MRLTLSLDDDQQPLCMNGAIVAWVAGNCFGVKFSKLKPHEYNRLRQHVRQMAGRVAMPNDNHDSRTVDKRVLSVKSITRSWLEKTA